MWDKFEDQSEVKFHGHRMIIGSSAAQCTLWFMRRHKPTVT